MALINCKECGSAASNKAKSCPKCGAKLPKKTSVLAWIMLVLSIYGIYSFMQIKPTSPKPEASKAVEVQEWRNTTTVNKLTGAKSSFAISPRAMPTNTMSFPYHSVEAWLGIGCSQEDEWAYIGFSDAPNFKDTQTESGYDLITTRIRWDDIVKDAWLSQEWGDSVVRFFRADGVISDIVSSEKMLIELHWYGERVTYFDFPLAGSSEALNVSRKQCAGYQD